MLMLCKKTCYAACGAPVTLHGQVNAACALSSSVSSAVHVQHCIRRLLRSSTCVTCEMNTALLPSMGCISTQHCWSTPHTSVKIAD